MRDASRIEQRRNLDTFQVSSQFIYLLAYAGDRFVRRKLLVLSPSSSATFFLPEKDAPRPLNSTVRLVTLARFLRVSSSQTFWTTAARSFPLILRSIGIPSPTLMVAVAAAAATDRSRQEGERKKKEKKEDAKSERNSEPLVSKTRFS